MFPAQAVAEVMLARGWRVVLSTDARGASYTGGFPPQVLIEQVSSATFAKGGFLNKVLVPIRIALGITAARRKMRRDRPKVVVGFGGYPAIPAMGAATSLGVPCMLHEQNGVLGRVNNCLRHGLIKSPVVHGRLNYLRGSQDTMWEIRCAPMSWRAMLRDILSLAIIP